MRRSCSALDMSTSRAEVSPKSPRTTSRSFFLCLVAENDRASREHPHIGAEEGMK